MLALPELRGMRFPDEYVVRMFFKERLHTAPVHVLELGSGSGNNLMLFQQYGWRTTGIDIDPASLDDARHNLGQAVLAPATLIQADLSSGLRDLPQACDAILLPSVNYYIPRQGFETLLRQCKDLLKPGGVLYLRSRTTADWRFARGREVERNGFVLDCPETGERGLLNVFYEAAELLEMLAAGIGPLEGQASLRVRYENLQSGSVIANDDIVIWGRRPRA